MDSNMHGATSKTTTEMEDQKVKGAVIAGSRVLALMVVG